MRGSCASSKTEASILSHALLAKRNGCADPIGVFHVEPSRGVLAPEQVAARLSSPLVALLWWFSSGDFSASTVTVWYCRRRKIKSKHGHAFFFFFGHIFRHSSAKFLRKFQQHLPDLSNLFILPPFSSKSTWFCKRPWTCDAHWLKKCCFPWNWTTLHWFL